MDLAAGSPGHDADALAIDVYLEAAVAGSDSYDLAGVDHAYLDALGSHHDGAAPGYAPLNNDRIGR
jgi:hypothetical protein